VEQEYKENIIINVQIVQLHQKEILIHIILQEQLPIIITVKQQQVHIADLVQHVRQLQLIITNVNGAVQKVLVIIQVEAKQAISIRQTVVDVVVMDILGNLPMPTGTIVIKVAIV
jgi:hypothetical protein